MMGIRLFGIFDDVSPIDYREMTLESCRGTLEGPEWIHTSSSNLFINRPSVTIVVCPSINIYSIHTSPRRVSRQLCYVQSQITILTD